MLTATKRIHPLASRQYTQLRKRSWRVRKGRPAGARAGGPITAAVTPAGSIAALMATSKIANQRRSGRSPSASMMKVARSSTRIIPTQDAEERRTAIRHRMGGTTRSRIQEGFGSRACPHISSPGGMPLTKRCARIENSSKSTVIHHTALVLSEPPYRGDAGWSEHG